MPDRKWWDAKGSPVWVPWDSGKWKTDLGLDVVTLPLYYGLAEGAWKHWARVWEVDYDWLAEQFAPPTTSPLSNR